MKKINFFWMLMMVQVAVPSVAHASNALLGGRKCEGSIFSRKTAQAPIQASQEAPVAVSSGKDVRK